MPSWVFKAISQGVISILPKNHYWNHLFQKYFSKTLSLDKKVFELKLLECKKHLEILFSLMPVYKQKAFSVFESRY